MTWLTYPRLSLNAPVPLSIMQYIYGHHSSFLHKNLFKISSKERSHFTCNYILYEQIRMLVNARIIVKTTEVGSVFVRMAGE